MVTTLRRTLEALACGLVALAAYLLLHQETLYAADAHGFLMQIERGGVAVHPHHFLYLPALALGNAAAGWLGLRPYLGEVGVSAVGAAIGVACAHAANRRLLPRGAAFAATALVATVPALVFFATVVEVHALHFGACGLAFLATAWFAQRPGLWRGLGLGLAMGPGVATHATGALLPALVVPLAMALAPPRGDRARGLAGLVVAVLVHLAWIVALPIVAHRFGAAPTDASSAAVLERHVSELCAEPSVLATAAWREWLWPYLPTAPFVVFALLRRGQRAIGSALVFATAVYLVVSAALMIPFVDGARGVGFGSERGAYLVPLAWPLGLVAARVLGARAAWLLLVSVPLAVLGVWRHDTRAQRAFAEGLRAELDGRACFVIAGGHDEVAAFVVDLPERRLDVDWQVPLRLDTLPDERLDAAWAAYDGWLGAKCTAGVEVWLTAGAERVLADPGWNKGRPGGPRILAGLRANYDWNPVHRGGFNASRLLPRRR